MTEECCDGKMKRRCMVCDDIRYAFQPPRDINAYAYCNRCENWLIVPNGFIQQCKNGKDEERNRK